MASKTGVSSTGLDLAGIDPADVYSVTELSQNIKQVLAGDSRFNSILLKGEISNFMKAASGHIYFNIKDESCVIACAFFKHLHGTECNDIGNGIQVIAVGSVATYEPRSQYQLSVKQIIPIGDGVSALKLRRLKETLHREGLFSADKKRPISVLPSRVGIITSRDSAAITDILTVVNSRCPKVDLVMAYVTLQGDGAASSMIRALNRLSAIDSIDTIVLARGGGPAEDFMVFNDEELVRAIGSCRKPVITGIGHERDTSLADLVADLRASTPSTAAKAAIPDIQEMRNGLNSLKASLNRSYDSYCKGLQIKANEVELGKKVEEIKALEGAKVDTFKYKAIIIALIVLLVLIVVVLLLKGVLV